jgi:cytochrome c6
MSHRFIRSVAIAVLLAAVSTACGSDGQVTAADGREVWDEAQCGSCHVLADAGSKGAVGANLDQIRPVEENVFRMVTFGRGQMPSFEDQLSESERRAVAKYVSEVAGS